MASGKVDRSQQDDNDGDQTAESVVTSLGVHQSNPTSTVPSDQSEAAPRALPDSSILVKPQRKRRARERERGKDLVRRAQY